MTDGENNLFQQALALWHDLVAGKSHTPRSLKRFMNRVRYFAMGLGSAEAVPRYAPTRFSGWLPMFHRQPPVPGRDTTRERGVGDPPAEQGERSLHINECHHQESRPFRAG